MIALHYSTAAMSIGLAREACCGFHAISSPKSSAWITTGSGPSLEDAVEMAVDELVQRLMRHLGLSRTEAFLLVSARGDVRIGQCARIRGLDTTAYAVFPKTVERLSS